jgi:Ca2+-binding EF-hand superfamily protein
MPVDLGWGRVSNCETNRNPTEDSAMRRLLTTTAAALLLASGVAMAQFNEWDTDGDGQVTEEEFMENAEYGDAFSEWDEDGDGMLNEDEFAGGIYSEYDEDGDGYWSDEEYSAFEDDDWF